MNAPTALEIEARIDALSEQYAARLTEAQLRRFWDVYRRSQDAALLYLEMCVATIEGQADQLALLMADQPPSLCVQCGEAPKVRERALCRTCLAPVRAAQRVAAKARRAALPAQPLQRQCATCGLWMTPAKLRTHRHRVTPTPATPKPAAGGTRRGKPGWLSALGKRREEAA